MRRSFADSAVRTPRWGVVLGVVTVCSVGPGWPGAQALLLLLEQVADL